jgi:hypothetical protein
MCNLYSITTNQEAIRALFRVVNRYVGNLAPMPGVFPDYPAHRNDSDAVGNAAAAAYRWSASDKHSQHLVPALARQAEARKPLPRAVQQLR